MASTEEGERKQDPAIHSASDAPVQQALSRVNRRLSARVDELEVNHADLKSVVAATDIATICLDTEVKILWFTPAIQQVVRLDSSAEGRPLAEFAHDFVDGDVVAVARQVLDSLAPVKSEVHCHDDRTFIRRVAPYRADGGHVGGVVITFIDITERKRSETELAAAKEFSEKIINTVREPMLVLTPNLCVVSANNSSYSHFQASPAETEGRLIYELGNGQWDIPELRRLLGDILPNNEVFNGFHVEHEFEQIGRRDMLLNARRIDHVDRILLAIEDVTERHESEKALRESESRLAGELAAMTRLHDLVARLLVSPDFATALEEVLSAAIDITDAEMGIVQVFDPRRGVLEIVAQHGFRQDFLDHFREVTAEEDESVCGRALKRRERVVIEDVQSASESLPASYREIAALAGYRAVQSTPLIGRGRELLGMLSTHYSRPHRPSERDLRVLDLYTRQASDFIEHKRDEEERRRLTETLEQQVEQRTWAIRLMQDVAVIANEADSVNDALRRALERVCSQLGWPVGHAYLRDRDDPRILVSSGIWFLPDPERFALFQEATSGMEIRPGEGLIGRVVATRELQWSPDVMQDPGFERRGDMEGCEIRAAVAFPILVRDEVAGVLEFYACEVAEPDDDLVQGMAQFGVQLGRVIERQRLKEEIAEATAHEHRVIGQELHDTITQEIVGIGMLAEQLRAHLQKLGSPETELAERISKLLRKTNRHVRQISHNQMPVEVDSDGLPEALRMLARNTEELRDVRCRVEGPRSVALNSGSAASHLYRIAQEAVQNAIRHAEATEIVIRLTNRTGILLEIRDNGHGMTEPDQAHGMGLRIMRHRAGLIGAELHIDTQPGDGTTVTCRMPLRS